MTANERARRYTGVAIALHWTIAVLILGMIAAGWWMTRGEGPGAAAPGTLRFTVFQLHKSFGVTILLLSVARVAWRLMNPPPPPPAGVAGWEKLGAKAVHWAFYGLMILLPLTGWALVSSSPTGFPTILFGVVGWPHLPLPASEDVAGAFDLTHATLAWTALVLIALHVGAALKHQLFDHTNMLGRMAPSLFPPADPPAHPGRGVVATLGAPVAVVLLVFAAGTIAVTGAHTPNSTVSAADGAGEGWSWNIDPAASKITFAGTQYGMPFEGAFNAWTAEILFDPSDLGSARVRVAVDTTSAKTGDATVDGSLASQSWLDSGAHPEATFESTSFKSTGADAYEATGTLTLKGVSQPLTLPFTLSLEGDTARAEGSVTVDRRAFQIGTDTRDNDSAVSPEIMVTVKVEASRAQ
jgi:cytochrome b561